MVGRELGTAVEHPLRVRRRSMASPAGILFLLSLTLAEDAQAASFWSPAGSLALSRQQHTTVLLQDGTLLVTGGCPEETKACFDGQSSALSASERYDPQLGRSRLTGDLLSARYLHSGSLLPNGKVLVAGGLLGSTPLASAELYDPATESWVLTGPMATARYSHTATLLADGKVLVVGGIGAAGTLAEIYDPATGTWTGTGVLSQARAYHTATLLPDGTVLVAGGDDGASGLANAERYDPTSGLWNATGSLGAPRVRHTATVVSTGAVVVVVVAGGDPGGGGPIAGPGTSAVATAEVYDPMAGTWSPTGALGTARTRHAAALLPGGQILVAGGDTKADEARYTSFLSSAEVYDPGAGTWSATASLSNPRGYSPTATVLPSGGVLLAGGHRSHAVAGLEVYTTGAGSWTTAGSFSNTGGLSAGAALLPDGRVLLAGGRAPVFAGAAIFDPASGSWSSTASLARARYVHTMTLLPDGRVLAVGGQNDPDTAEIYDPGSGSWSTASAPALARAQHTATLLPDGRVLVVGGELSPESAEIYDPATGPTGQWTPTGSLSLGRYGHSAVLLGDGRVLAIGGTSYGAFVSTAEAYDPATGIWRPVASARYARSDASATLLADGRVLVAGGFAGVGLAEAEVFDPVAESWSSVASMSTPRNGHSATLLLDGRVLVAGGSTTVIVPYVGLKSAEIYDPASNAWTSAADLAQARFAHRAVALADGRVLVAAGTPDSFTPLFSSEVYDPNDFPPTRRPTIDATSTAIAYGTPFAVTGSLAGDSEASLGGTANSAVNYPLVSLTSVASGKRSWLVPDPRQNFSDDPMTLTVSPPPIGRGLPSGLDAGWHHVRVVTAGVPSVSRLVAVACSVAITKHPEDAIVPLDAAASFEVRAQGARSFQWRKNEVDISGATASRYTTPPAAGADSGSQYRVVVGGNCTTATSDAATLTVADSVPPSASVVSPSGGEYWLLSNSSGPANTQQVTWSMSDNVRICRVTVSLLYSTGGSPPQTCPLYSTDGGLTFQNAPSCGAIPNGAQPAVFGSGGSCPYPGVGVSNLTYSVPTAFPSGATGSLYKVQVTVSDQVGLTTVAQSANPFYIVQSNPDSVRTLIFANTARMQSKMGVSPAEATALGGKLQELANNPKVLGFNVDLSGVTDLFDPNDPNSLYRIWDADPSNPDKANNVLFGCHTPYPAGCPTDRERNGVHDQTRTLMGIYTGVKYVVLVGDDRIIPMVRVADHTSLFSESNYPNGSDLTPTGTTVGQALSANKYLSDDPLVVLDAVRSDELSANLYLPDLAVGRLVETPAEITTAIATFISQDGVLDLSALNATTGHKVLVTGYDFLTDSSKRVRDRWKSVFPTVDGAVAPVDGALVGGNWGFTSVPERVTALETHLGGNGGARYGVASLSGHAAHFEEGVPGTNPFDIVGLEASDLQSLNLAGGVIYAVGCHGALPVPGSNPADGDNSLDLPQTFLSRGVVAYVANTGYGWGLKHGIGYGERLTELLTQELTRGGTVVAGEAVRRTKLKYYADTPRYDAYDEKSLMQWTLFGLPMYAIKTGIPTGGAGVSPPSAPSFEGPAPKARPALETLGGVAVRREPAAPTVAAPLPSFLTQLNLHFDFTASGVYEKRNAAGDTVGTPGCSDPDGCYYTLNGLSTGAGDLPIQPYFIYDSRLSGTSQHGVLWKGGVYDEESGWIPVIGELFSNGGDGSNHGNAPRKVMIHATSPRIVPGVDPDGCRPSDLEINSTVVGAGEAVKDQDTDPVYSIERKYRTIDLEVFYFNNTLNGLGNCDRTGPVIGAGPYHQVGGGTITWSVPVTDDSAVWRVIVVVNDNTTNGQGRGTWVPVELTFDGASWTGGRTIVASSRATYVIQAVDVHGNVTWADFTAAQTPSSGVDLGVPLPIDVTVTPGTAALAIDDVVVTEPESGSTNAFFTVSLSEPTDQLVTVDFATVDGAASAGSDYLSRAGTLTFAPGVTAQYVPVPILSGGALESTETFFVNLSGATALVSKARGEGWILDGSSGRRVRFGVGNYSVGEGGVKATITVVRTGPTGGTVIVDYEASDGTAIGGSDYTPKTGTLVFDPGVIIKTFTVPITNDTLVEGPETVLLSLKNPTSAALGNPSTAVLTIVDNDLGGKIQFGSATYSVGESGPQATITVNRSLGTASGVTVEYATSDGTATAGSDYIAASGILSFGAGMTTQTFTVEIKEDVLTEGDETLNLTLSGPTGGATLGPKSLAKLTILENESTVQFTNANYTVKEGTATAVITVKRSGPTAGTVTVGYATSDGTALAGSDYAGTSGTLTFGAGIVTRTFAVPITNDTVQEGDEAVLLSLTNPTGGPVLGQQSTAVLTIQDNDPGGTIQFSLLGYSVSETMLTATITVTRTGGTASNVMVDFATSDGTAVDGTDYTGTTGTLTFAAGQTSRTFTVGILNDGLVDSDKTVNLTLSNPTGGAGLGSRSTTVLTIRTADPVVQFSAASYVVKEGTPTATITVKRSGPTAGTVMVDFATSDGTATEGQDYTATAGTLTFGPSVTVKTFTVPITNDLDVEGDETVNLGLSSPSGASLGPKSTAVLTILTDNTSFQFGASTYTVTESAPAATITVSRSAPLVGMASVDFATADGTAHEGTDYTATSGTLTFGPSVASRTFPVKILNDTVHEVGETVDLALSNPSPGTVLGARDMATLTIATNDAAGVIQFSVSNYSVSETGPVATITVTRTGGTASGVTIDYAASDGTAIAGTNYLATSGALIFGDGEASKTFTVPVLDDLVATPNQTVTLTLSNPTGGATLGARSTATLWIVENQ